MLEKNCCLAIFIYLSFEIEMSRVEYDHFIKWTLPFVALFFVTLNYS